MHQQTNIKPGETSALKVISLVMSLFFAFGFCTVLVDTLIPKLKALFALSYTEVMLTQFCFLDRKSTRLNSSHLPTSRMPSSA